MTFWFQAPDDSVPASWAGGQATFGQLTSAAYYAAAFVDNFSASSDALDQAYSRRIAAVQDATGVTLANPLTAYIPAGKAIVRDPNAQRNFDRQLIDLQKQYPDKADKIRAQVPIAEDARQIAFDAGTTYDHALASRQDFMGKWAAALGGGFAGSLRDPLNVAALFAGGAAAPARTLAGTILKTAAREAIVNGAFVAAQQPQVQAWRNEVGLPSGFDQGLLNTVAAAGLAGVLGGGGRAIGELAGRLLRDVPPEAPIHGAVSGDGNTAAKVMAPIADTLRSEARGAIHSTQADAAILANRPSGIDPATHDANVGNALTAAEDGGPITVIDMTQRRQQTPLNRPVNLFEYMAQLGGLRDDQSELANRGRNFTNSMTRNGPYYRAPGVDNGHGGTDMFGNVSKGKLEGPGLSPDQMREALVEAGYLVDQGRISGGEATTTTEDLYAAIDRQLSGKTVVAQHDLAWQHEIDQARLAKEEKLQLKEKYGKAGVDFITRYGFRLHNALQDVGIDISTVHPADAEAAAKMIDSMGMDPLNAYETAVMRAANADTKRVARKAKVIDIPFFEDQPHAGSPADGGALPPGSSADAGRGSASGVPDQRPAGGASGQDTAGAAAAAEPVAPPPPPPATAGGIDDPAAAAVVSDTQAEIDRIKADPAQMAREIWAEFPDGSKSGATTVADMIAEAERPQHLADLVMACKG